MKIVYIAHPLSGDLQGNLKKVSKIIRDINLTDPNVVPFAHYFVDCYALDDDDPFERERGIKNDTVLLKAGFIDEMWLYGNQISNGMRNEIKLAKELNIPVFPMTTETFYFDK
jgi:hypothetical protein